MSSVLIKESLQPLRASALLQCPDSFVSLSPLPAKSTTATTTQLLTEHRHTVTYTTMTRYVSPHAPAVLHKRHV